jgi:hypothetical protein
MAYLPLSQGKFVLVDDKDYPLLADFKWCYRAEKNGKQGYAVRHVRHDGKDRLCYLHRLIMNPPPEHEVIFENHDRLDCRRGNLKVVPKEEAKWYHRVRKDSKSGSPGVHYDPDSCIYRAYITRNGRQHHVGSFDNEAEAAFARRNYQEILEKQSEESAVPSSQPGPVVGELANANNNQVTTGDPIPCHEEQ